MFLSGVWFCFYFFFLSGRIKRAEDVLQEDRSAVQSLVTHTRNLEQAMVNTQKDVFARRDLQASRLDELRIQIDDVQRSKENLERSAFSLIDEIKSLKSKVDVEALNLNSISSDLRNKTRRLEDENRQQVSVFFCCCWFDESIFYFEKILLIFKIIRKLVNNQCIVESLLNLLLLLVSRFSFFLKLSLIIIMFFL
jgi:hypothetical protein